MPQMPQNISKDAVTISFFAFKPRKKAQKVDSHKNSALSISAKWVKKSLVSFKRNFNDLSINAVLSTK